MPNTHYPILSSMLAWSRDGDSPSTLPSHPHAAVTLTTRSVIPAQAGTQLPSTASWVPACAGMTIHN